MAACDYAQRQRGELNRINVFPVPDGDTGTNLALTVQAIADKLRFSTDRSVSVVADEAAQAAVLGARGNCGMMLSHFLLGMAEHLEGRDRILTSELGIALRAGVDNLYAALERPVEGTILTVMRDTAQAATTSAVEDFQVLIHEMVSEAKASLKRTPDLLPALQKAGVVDAGAKGFYHLVEGVHLYVRGDVKALAASSEDASEGGAAVARVAFDPEEEQYQFCTEALVRGDGLPDAPIVRSALRDMGDSLIVIRSRDVLKVHIHSDEPDDVFGYLRSVGELVTHKAEDMKIQHETVERSAGAHITLARRPITILTDSASDIPSEIVQAHGIQVVPLWLMQGEAMLRDRFEITAEEFHRRLADHDELPTTSQPAPADFLAGYQRAAEDGEKILGITVSSTLSGTFASAEAAAFRFKDAEVYLADSLGASLLQGLLVLKAAELAELGQEPEDILLELARIRAQSGILFTVRDLDRIIASGRASKSKALLGRFLGLRPIFGLTPAGKLRTAGATIKGRGAMKKLMGALEREIPSGVKKIRFGMIHVACPEILPELRSEIQSRWGRDVEILTAPATSVIATHTGVGTWGVAYIVED
jgi:DegV family protein with EDD domain